MPSEERGCGFEGGAGHIAVFLPVMVVQPDEPIRLDIKFLLLVAVPVREHAKCCRIHRFVTNAHLVPLLPPHDFPQSYHSAHRATPSAGGGQHDRMTGRSANSNRAPPIFGWAGLYCTGSQLIT